jgi:hypothetical protein
VTFWNSVFTFAVILGFTLLFVDILTRGRGFLVGVEELELIGALFVIAVVGSPLLVTLYDLGPVTKENGEDLLAIYSKPQFWAVFKPRLVIARGMSGPNAFAAGIWPVSFIAVTPELLELVRGNDCPLNESHLEAILLHEMAHHKLGHALFFPVIRAIMWIGEQSWKRLKQGVGIPISIVGIIVGTFVRLLFMEMSRQFEIAADALAAYGQGTSRDLINALVIISEMADLPDVPWGKLLAYHPSTKARAALLERLDKES